MSEAKRFHDDKVHVVRVCPGKLAGVSMYEPEKNKFYIRKDLNNSGNEAELNALTVREVVKGTACNRKTSALSRSMIL